MSTTTYRTNRKTGQPLAVIRLDPGERAVILKPGQHALVISDGDFYRLGGQTDLIVGAHVLEEADHVTWDSIEQRWMEVGDKVVHDGTE